MDGSVDVLAQASAWQDNLALGFPRLYHMHYGYGQLSFGAVALDPQMGDELDGAGFGLDDLWFHLHRGQD